MAKLLLEIFSEETPANMQYKGLLAIQKLLAENLNSDSIRSVISPRHICLEISDLELNQRISVKGPKIGANAALEGFMKKYGVKKEELTLRDGVYFLEKEFSLEKSFNEIRNKIELSLSSMVWPKSMKWGNNYLEWIRPIHAITCMINDKQLQIELGHIKSSNITYGHRSKFSPRVEINSANLEDYIKCIRDAGVIVSQEERKQSILIQISKIVTNLNIRLLEDEELLDEIVGLVENPKVFLGKIDKKFMSLPREVLITSLKNHQKYLLLNDFKDNLAPYFIIVSDIDPDDDGKTVIEGNEKVLAARLSDAQHFINTDLQTRFETLTEKLHKIQFHKDVGSLYEKVVRIKNIAKSICYQIGVDSIHCERAAMLCKNDLVTGMVGEFPELQGIVGYYYSKINNESASLAIRDQYKPCGPNDSLPETLEGCILAIADKLDTLISLFKVGIKPTSTKDPYALRRAALGILRIILSQEVLIEKIKLDATDDVIAFITERAKHLYKDSELEIILPILKRD